MPNSLIETRKVLVAAIDDLTNLARSQEALGHSPEPYLLEVTRLVLRLRNVQNEIETYDLD